MKRILISIAAVLLTAAMLAGCVSVNVNTWNSNTPAPVTPSPTPAPSLAPKELTRGTIEGSVYTNESAELTFTAPFGWVYYTDKEIADMAGTDGVSDGVYTCDMFVENKLAKSNLAVEYLDLTAIPGGVGLDEEALLDKYKEAMLSLNDYEFTDYPDASIGPNTFKAIIITSPNDDVIQYYYIRRAGSYYISITATIPPGSTDDIGSIMTCFFAEKLKRGTFSGNVYSSGFSCITFTLPEGWAYSSDETLAELSLLGKDEFPKPGCEYHVAEMKQFNLCDMAASNSPDATVAVFYQNLSLYREGMGISTQQFIDKVKGYPNLEGAKFGEVYETVISGKTYNALKITMAEIDFTQYCYFRKAGKYMLLIMVSFFGNDNIDDVMARFS